MSELRRRIAELAPEQRAALESRLRQGHAARPSEDRIQRRARRTPCPLSFAQQRLWLLDQMQPDTPVYTIAKALRLDGPLDVAALRRALDAVVERHEVLRTTFALDNGIPVQVIADGRPAELAVMDLRDRPAADRELEASRRLEQEARRPYDLSRDAMLRALVLRLGDRDSALLLTMHHIASDGWSMGILARELSTLYDAHVTGRSPRLPELPLQYADYAVWQRQWLQGARLEGQLGYWTERLAGAPALLELPGDRTRPPIQSHRGARHTTFLPASLSEALKALSRREGATFFMTLLAAFQALLYRYTGQDDLVVGSPIANRDRLEIEGLIGFFVNTLVLRADLSGDPTFRELLARVRAAAPGAYTHQNLPFERLVEELQPARTLSSTPLFQVMFVLQNAPTAALELPGLTTTPLELDSGTAMFDLTLYTEDTAAGLRATLEYSTDLFDAATTSRMLGHWRRLLEGVAADPDARVSALPLLTDPEREQLLVSWNATRAEYPADTGLSALFEQQVERTPEALALICAGERVSFRELNRRANRLAHRLRTLGVGLETPVGLYMPRSIEAVAALLAVLKAGGAYLPLDPTYPRERLQLILDDARPPVLLATRRLVPDLPGHGARVVCLEDAEEEALDPAGEDNPVGLTNADSVAYILYTSGSTGRPKGVLGLHRGAVNRLAWMWRAFPFTAGEVCPQKTSLNFVDSVWELFGPMLRGIPTVILPDDAVQDPQALVSTLAAHRVTRIVLVPSLLRVLLDAVVELGSRLPALRIWISSGEALPKDLAERFLDRVPHGLLLNLYGASEASADSTWHDVRSSRDLPFVPIGRPIANTEVYVLDRHRQPVPVGVPGELFLGGVGLARGYLDRPELTAERFIPHPFRLEPGARLYRTGDLARFRPDGTLQHLGRLDHQVKLRGFRIELGEIESVLAGHPAVHQAAVLLREDRPGDGQLVAYAASSGTPAPVAGDLRRFLRDRLPAYMVPSAFVVLPRLPLAPNGKLDRKALPSPGPVPVDAHDPAAAPATPTERLLAEIWRDLLGTPNIRVTDNFFDLGGHSLLAIQVLAQIQSALGLDLPVRVLFDAPTVAGLATLVEQQAVSRAEPEELDRIMAEVEQLSDDEVEAQLLDGMSVAQRPRGA